MKPYLLFAFQAYDSVGGWHDFRESFDTYEEALEDSKGYHYHVVQIVHEGEILFEEDVRNPADEEKRRQIMESPPDRFHLVVAGVVMSKHPSMTSACNEADPSPFKSYSVVDSLTGEAVLTKNGPFSHIKEVQSRYPCDTSSSSS